MQIIVYFKKDWRSFKKDDVAEFEISFAGELIASEICQKADAKQSRNYLRELKKKNRKDEDEEKRLAKIEKFEAEKEAREAKESKAQKKARKAELVKQAEEQSAEIARKAKADEEAEAYREKKRQELAKKKAELAGEAEDVEEKEMVKKPLSKMNKTELIAEAEARNIELSDTYTMADILEAIKLHDGEPQ